MSKTGANGRSQGRQAKRGQPMPWTKPGHNGTHPEHGAASRRPPCTITVRV